jgi:hypothetical protein
MDAKTSGEKGTRNGREAQGAIGEAGCGIKAEMLPLSPEATADKHTTSNAEHPIEDEEGA